MNNESTQQPNLDQDEHDKWLVSQSDQAIQELAQGVAQLARLKEQSGALSSGNVLPESENEKPLEK
jgi:hypothetical protein